MRGRYKMLCQSNMLQNSNIGDLTVYNWGQEKCTSGHSYGPAVRDHYLIHYILDGKGIFQVGDETYHLTKGQGFLICPDIITFYKADSEEPWHYTWVGFHGTKAKYYLELSNLKQDNPIFLYDQDKYIENCLMKMSAIDGFSEHDAVELTGLLYLFISKLIEIGGLHSHNIQSKDPKEVYVDRAIQYIERNYSRNLTISQLSHYIGINRKYLCQLFNKYLDRTPQQFLIDYRMDKASYLLKNTNLYVGDIARSVGYEDPLQFSKMFKKVKGISPKHYREKSIRQ